MQLNYQVFKLLQKIMVIKHQIIILLDYPQISKLLKPRIVI